jgi:hypothetical protein
VAIFREIALTLVRMVTEAPLLAVPLTHPLLAGVVVILERQSTLPVFELFNLALKTPLK